MILFSLYFVRVLNPNGGPTERFYVMAYLPELTLNKSKTRPTCFLTFLACFSSSLLSVRCLLVPLFPCLNTFFAFMLSVSPLSELVRGGLGEITLRGVPKIFRFY